MPIPEPNEGEQKQEYLRRCMSFLQEEEDNPKQNIAICLDKWEKSRREGDSAKDCDCLKGPTLLAF
jgi:hypothetical protein